MTDEEFDRAAAYWERKDGAPDAKHMDPDALLAEIDSFLAARHVCALGCASDGFVRVTPVEYDYVDGDLWIFTEGGEKFRALKGSPQVSVAVFDPSMEGGLASLQLQGTCEVVEPWGADYLRLLAFKGLPEERMRELPSVMNLLRVRWSSADLLESSLRQRGFDARQHAERQGHEE